MEKHELVLRTTALRYGAITSSLRHDSLFEEESSKGSAEVEGEFYLASSNLKVLEVRASSAFNC